jgi:hypothetical protein
VAVSYVSKQDSADTGEFALRLVSEPGRWLVARLEASVAVRRLFLVALALTILLPLLAVMLVFLAAAGESSAQCGALFAGSSRRRGDVLAVLVLVGGGARSRRAAR